MTAVTTVYPLTLEQEAIWVDDYLGDGPSCYLESWVHQFTGPLDHEAVRHAWSVTAGRHDALRSTFGLDHDDEAGPVQKVLPTLEHSALVVHDCAAGILEATVRDLVTAPMDLDAGAVRATLLDVDADTAVLVVQLHHIVTDDWSLHLMEREFQELYTAAVEGRAPVLNPVPLQPGPYAVRQRAAPTDPAATSYWRLQLADQRDGPGPSAGGPAERLLFTIEAPLARRLRRLCGRLRVTPFTAFLATTAVVLCADGAGEDLAGATPVSRRGSSELDQVVAPLSQLLPLRLRVRLDDSFADLVAQARTTTHEAINFGGITHPELTRLTRRRGRSRNHLTAFALVLDDASDATLSLPGVDVERLHVFSGITKTSLCLYVTAIGARYECMLDHVVEHYRTADARLLIDRTLALLDTVATDASITVGSLIDALVTQAVSPPAR